MGLFRTAVELEALETSEQFEAVLEESHRRPVWILKHSTACGTSFRALRQYQRFAEQSGAGSGEEPEAAAGEGTPRFLVLDLRRHRALSNAVAERTGVRHQSPQALLLRAGEAVWSASHGSVTVAGMSAAKPGESILPPPIFR